MLSKKYRIPKTDFKNLFKKGKHIHSNEIALIFRQKEHLRNNQFTVIISTKIANAVIRNSIKRKIKHILQKNLSRIKKGYQIGFLLKRNVDKTDKEALEEIIIKLLEKAELLS